MHNRIVDFFPGLCYNCGGLGIWLVTVVAAWFCGYPCYGVFSGYSAGGFVSLFTQSRFRPCIEGWLPRCCCNLMSCHFFIW